LKGTDQGSPEDVDFHQMNVSTLKNFHRSARACTTSMCENPKAPPQMKQCIPFTNALVARGWCLRVSLEHHRLQIDFFFGAISRIALLVGWVLKLVVWW
jgi:hypothetical protein